MAKTVKLFRLCAILFSVVQIIEDFSFAIAYWNGEEITSLWKGIGYSPILVRALFTVPIWLQCEREEKLKRKIITLFLVLLNLYMPFKSVEKLCKTNQDDNLEKLLKTSGKILSPRSTSAF